MKLENLLCDRDRTDFYSEIKKYQENSHKCLYVWGTGSVAAGVVRECEKHSIKLDGLFVNVTEYNTDPRVESQKLPIFQLEELLKSEEKFAVIIGHAHYEYISNIKNIPQIEKIWCLTSTVRNDIDISETFVRENLSQLQASYDALYDEQSKRNMAAYLNAKITGQSQYIIDVFGEASTYFRNDVLTMPPKACYLDLGAYDGKSIQEFIEACPSYNKIIAVEVQPEMARLLHERYKDNERIIIHNVGISDHIGVDHFNFDSQSTCLAEHGTKMQVSTVDRLCEQEPAIDIIKICIGNTIIPLLSGARDVLCRHRPQLIISAGIDRRALLDYIPLIDRISANGYRYCLRFNHAMTESLVLYAVPLPQALHPSTEYR